MYAVSFQFLQRSIESWFDVRLDESLTRGLNLGQRVLQNSLKELAAEGATSMAQSLATAHGQRGRDAQPPARARTRSTRPRSSRRAAASSRSRARSPVSLLPDLPSPDVLRQVRTQQRWSRDRADRRPRPVPARDRAGERAHDRRRHPRAAAGAARAAGDRRGRAARGEGLHGLQAAAARAREPEAASSASRSRSRCCSRSSRRSRSRSCSRSGSRRRCPRSPSRRAPSPRATTRS